MSAFADLKQRVERIHTIIRAAELARQLPDQRANDARRIDFRSTGYDSKLSDSQLIIASRMREAAIAEERAAGEVARDRELKRLASELDLLRKELPAIAAAARFDLLTQVLEMRL